MADLGRRRAGKPGELLGAGPGPDGGARAQDGRAGDGPSGDEPSGDEPSGDEPSGDGPSGDGPSGDGPSGDGPGREGPNGEGHGEVALLSANEALQRLDLLSQVSAVLDASLHDYEDAARRVAEACVPAFADLCAIDLVGPGGQPFTVAYTVAADSGLRAPVEWAPVEWAPAERAKVGLAHGAGDGPVLVYEGMGAGDALAQLRQGLNAPSLIVAPIAEGGLRLGSLVLATGPERRGFRASAVRIAVEVASRLATAVKQATLHVEMQSASREQARAVRRLRRLATAAANLAGAATTTEVLHVACREACLIQEADGAMARWWMPDGTIEEARAGRVDEALAEQAFEATAGRRLARAGGWVAYPLLPSQVNRRAALVIFARRELSYDEELVLASLASLVPVAFERALGTGAALAQEARVRAVVSSSPVALVGLGTTDLIMLANPAAELLFGWLDSGVQASLPPSLEPAFRELAEAVRTSGTVVNRVVSAPPFELSLSAAPMPALVGGGDELSVLVAATDLSEVKRAERALVQAQRLEAMGLVAGRVAHDFNNLLTVIIGYAELLARSSDGEVPQLAAANINNAARRAASLTQQLLGLATKQHDLTAAVDLAEELRALRPLVERMAGERVSARVACPEEPVAVALGPGGAQQVLLNLALNACQAMQDTGGSLVLALEVVGPDAASKGAGAPPRRSTNQGAGRGWAILSVVDDGPGMSDYVRAHCLEPFFTTKARGHGTGLGLPTVHALVADGGGSVEVRSAPGEGTTVTVRLPLAEDLPVARSADPVPAAWPVGEVLSGRALVVEDDDEIRELAVRALRAAGLQVTGAGSAEAGLGAVAAAASTGSPFEVLVTDVMLPGRSGLDLAATLGAGAAELPVLFVTGYTEAVGPLPAPGPFVQVLHKPYRPDELVFALAVLLGAKSPLGGA